MGSQYNAPHLVAPRQGAASWHERVVRLRDPRFTTPFRWRFRRPCQIAALRAVVGRVEAVATRISASNAESPYPLLKMVAWSAHHVMPYNFVWAQKKTRLRRLACFVEANVHLYRLLAIMATNCGKGRRGARTLLAGTSGECRRSPSDMGPDRPSGEPWTAWWRGRSGPRSDGGRQTSRTQSTMDAIHG